MLVIASPVVVVVEDVVDVAEVFVAVILLVRGVRREAS